MVKILEHRNIPLDDLVIGKGQIRTDNVHMEIDSLARSIESQGLLQPIVVCPTNEQDRWEILAGQRRFLAHKKLKKETIFAAVLSEHVSEEKAKTISITENLVRRKLSGKELTDGILFLFNHYGTIQAVAEATGLPRNKVTENVRYPRLIPELKELVDNGEVGINVALKAQDASEDSDDSVATGEGSGPNAEVAVLLAKDMSTMSGVQVKRVAEIFKNNPELPTDEKIERAKSGANVTQIVVTVTRSTHAAIQQFARDEKRTQDEAVSALVELALTDYGYLEN